MSNYRRIDIGGNSIRFFHKGNADKQLVFLHGLGVPPERYEGLLHRLAKDHEVIAPNLYGTTRLRPQPTTIDEYTDLTKAFCKKVANRPSLVGHSIGGAIALHLAPTYPNIRSIVAINPLFPVTYWENGFIMRFIYKTLREVIGVPGENNSTGFGLTIPLALVADSIRDPSASSKLTTSICNFVYSGEVTQPTLILYGEDDEYFDWGETPYKGYLRGIEGRVKGIAPMAEIVPLKNRNHDWLIFSPRRAASEITRFIEEH